MTNTKDTTITAHSSHTPTTPRKSNLILESIVGLYPKQAITQLEFTTKRAAPEIIQLIKQGIGNAGDQHKLSADDLIIDQAFATKARTIKRTRFAGRGRIKPYQKVFSHSTIIFKSKKPQSTITPDKKISSKTKTAETIKDKKTINKKTK